jgi:hypothetical protein
VPKPRDPNRGSRVAWSVLLGRGPKRREPRVVLAGGLADRRAYHDLEYLVLAEAASMEGDSVPGALSPLERLANILTEQRVRARNALGPRSTLARPEARIGLSAESETSKIFRLEPQ